MKRTTEIVDIVGPLLRFDKFYRAQSGNITQARGFGLGLTYVKMVMDAIGGTIEVDSTLGKGSSFRLILPLMQGN